MNTQVQTYPFAKSFKRYFKSLIKRRTFLIESGKSKKNDARMRLLVEKLNQYSDYQFTDEGAAKFLINHKHEIRQLIPENAQITKDQFEVFVARANFYNHTKNTQL